MTEPKTATPKIDAALAACQGQLTATGKGGDGQSRGGKYKYSTLTDVWEAVRKPLSENGLSVTQTEGFVDNWITLTTTLRHTSGEQIEGTRPIYTVEGAIKDPQAYGSAVTYARRYGLTAMVGAAPDDDDGAAAKAAGHQSMGKSVAPGPRGGQDKTPPAQSEIKLYGYPEGGTRVTKTYERKIGGVASFLSDLEIAINADPMSFDTNREGIAECVKGINKAGRQDLRDKLDNLENLALDLGRNLGAG